MKKRLFFKLGLVVLTLSLVSCGQKDNSLVEDTASKTSTSQAISSGETSEEESVETIAPSTENKVESEQTDQELPKDAKEATEKGESKAGLFTVAGGTNKVQGICNYYLADLKVTPKIEPSIITESSASINVQTEDNTYIDVTLAVENCRNEAKMADEIITAKIKIGSNEYPCFSMVESVDGSSLDNSALINPLESRNIHYAVEVPLAEATGEIEVILTINGENFSNKFNL